MSIFEFENISKKIFSGALSALSPCQLDINEGEMIGLLDVWVRENHAVAIIAGLRRRRHRAYQFGRPRWSPTLHVA